jgi:aminoglycoside phosphotransferase (APT) family kinase protein
MTQRMSAEMGSDWVLLGRGKSSEVFRIGGGEVIKIYHPAVSEEMIDREMTAARLAASLTLPTAAPRTRVEVDGKRALIYPEIVGTSIAQAIRKKPLSAASLLRDMAALLHGVHSCPASGLRTVKSVLQTDIDYGPAPEPLKRAATDYLARLPEGDHLLHGDFHIDNILVSDGSLVILDWAKAAIGAPAADAIRSEMLMRFGEGPADAITNVWRDWAANQLDRAYRKQSGLTPDQLSLWRPIVALAWLRARPPIRSRAFTRYLNQALLGAGLPALS